MQSATWNRRLADAVRNLTRTNGASANDYSIDEPEAFRISRLTNTSGG